MTSGTTWLFLAPVIGLAVYCTCHIALTRVLRTQSPYAALLLAFVPGLACMLATTCAALAAMQAAWTDRAAYIFLNLTTYGALGWGYFHFVNLGIASLRIRILEELLDAGGSLPASALQMLYNTDRLIDTRIQRLNHGGHLLVSEGRYRIGKTRFLVTAKVFDWLRLLIFGITPCETTAR